MHHVARRPAIMPAALGPPQPSAGTGGPADEEESWA